MDLSSRLRAATHKLHEDIEGLPFARAMVSGRVSRRSYVDSLEQLLALHQTLEHELEQHDFLRVIYQPEQMARSAALRRDLAALGGAGDRCLTAPLHSLSRALRSWSLTAPHRLLGALYIMEGSRMGSQFLARPLARALRVAPEPGRGLDYHLEGQDQRLQLWKQFKLTMNALPLREGEAAAVVAGAVLTMQCLHDLYACCPSGDEECAAELAAAAPQAV